MIMAVELLLQERAPRDVATAPPRSAEVTAPTLDPDQTAVVRHFASPLTATPTAHLLSNGSYGVMLTPCGAGYSRWRGLAVTRWRDDPTTAQHGAYILARDRVSGAGWSASAQPGLDASRSGASHKVVFSEHEAVFTHSAGSLTTQTEIVVSAEDDAEARRVTLTNTGRTKREIDLTSCAELVLAPMAADVAHPAFSKLFVVTDFLPELGVLIATRRRRAPHDPEVWAAHIAVVEGTEVAAIGFETDRARFIGLDGSIRQAAMAGRRLSQTTGTVLDPVFAIRRSVLVPAGGPCRDAVLDAGTGAVAPSWRDARRGGRFPAAGRHADPRRCAAQGTRPHDHAGGRATICALALRDFGGPAHCAVPDPGCARCPPPARSAGGA
jgi:cyclic beta-1,2-glucan synthetase